MIGRATLDDITSSDGRRFLGFEPYKLDTFVNEGERKGSDRRERGSRLHRLMQEFKTDTMYVLHVQ